MATVLELIDAEIEKLQKVRSLLASTTGADGYAAKAVTHKARAKRVLSPEARKRIADAQRKRWAAQKKASK